MKVLVAVDDSPYSEAIIEELGARPWWGDTQFMVVNVAVAPTVSQWELWGLDVDWKLRDQILAAADSLVQDLAGLLQKLVTKGLKIETRVVEAQDNVSEAIAHVAKEWDADLIVVGSHGRSGFSKFLMGSVAQGTLLNAPCSVEVIKSHNALEAAKKPAKAKQQKKSGKDLESVII